MSYEGTSGVDVNSPIGVVTAVAAGGIATEDTIVLELVEDDPDLRTLLRMMLGRDSRLVLKGEAASADAAIDLARDLHPEIVILDNGLEGSMTGMEAAPKIKAASPGARVLLFSANDLEVEAAGEPAIDCFLRKDRISDLLPTIERMLGLQHQ